MFCGSFSLQALEFCGFKSSCVLILLRSLFRLWIPTWVYPSTCFPEAQHFPADHWTGFHYFFASVVDISLPHIAGAWGWGPEILCIIPDFPHSGCQAMSWNTFPMEPMPFSVWMMGLTWGTQGSLMGTLRGWKHWVRILIFSQLSPSPIEWACIFLLVTSTLAVSWESMSMTVKSVTLSFLLLQNTQTVTYIIVCRYSFAYNTMTLLSHHTVDHYDLLCFGEGDTTFQQWERHVTKMPPPTQCQWPVTLGEGIIRNSSVFSKESRTPLCSPS